MSSRLIVVGDRHSHGGVLTHGCTDARIDGKAIVRKGDPAECPQHGPTCVVTASSGARFDGAEAACAGDMLACGAVLIFSQSMVSSSHGVVA